MPKIIDDIIADVDDKISIINKYKKAINKEIENETKPNVNVYDAYNKNMDYLKENKNPHIDEIKKIYNEFEGYYENINKKTQNIKYLENILNKLFEEKNNILQQKERDYNITNQKYLINKNRKSATQILKLDTYDRNIEENIYIIYYLLSYGVIGFFIYKLLRMEK